LGKVYLEPVFLENAAMDMLILYIAGRLSGRRARIWRYLGASALGGLYAALSLLPFCIALNTFPAKAALSLLMALIAWRARGWLPYLKCWASFVGVTAVGGGLALAAAALLDKLGPPAGSLHIGSDALLLTILGAAAMVLFSMSALRRRGGANHRYAVRVWSGGRRYDLDALLDTGNMLHEPLSGLPVMIVDRSLEARLVAGRAVEIPFGTAAAGASTVRAVPAERVEVYRGGRWRAACDMYLAACAGRLAGGVEALLPPAALE
jgi:stage II sporulation protein GA (sporulation sigma-E factor processing peptidase)